MQVVSRTVDVSRFRVDCKEERGQLRGSHTAQCDGHLLLAADHSGESPTEVGRVHCKIAAV